MKREEATTMTEQIAKPVAKPTDYSKLPEAQLRRIIDGAKLPALKDIYASLFGAKPRGRPSVTTLRTKLLRELDRRKAAQAPEPEPEPEQQDSGEKLPPQPEQAPDPERKGIVQRLREAVGTKTEPEEQRKPLLPRAVNAATLQAEGLSAGQSRIVLSKVGAKWVRLQREGGRAFLLCDVPAHRRRGVAAHFRAHRLKFNAVGEGFKVELRK